LTKKNYYTLQRQLKKVEVPLHHKRSSKSSLQSNWRHSECARPVLGGQVDELKSKKKQTFSVRVGFDDLFSSEASVLSWSDMSHVFTSRYKITQTKTIQHAQRMRLHQQAVTVSEIVDGSGQFILEETWEGRLTRRLRSQDADIIPTPRRTF
jgi:hypothetical protein